MATKKIPSMEDALKYFKEVMQRASLHEYVNVNNIMLSKTPKGQSVLIVPELPLWNKILDDAELKENLKEFDTTKDSSDKRLFQYGENITDEWIEMNGESLYKGETINISIKDIPYEIPINKNLFCIRLKKAEFESIYYKLRITSEWVLLLRKTFSTPGVEGSKFEMIRILQII